MCLYELFVEDDRCFFTMELVNGVSFVDYVRGADRMPRFDDRLIDALRQLVDDVGTNLVPVRGFDTYCSPIFSAKLAFETALRVAI